MRPIETAEIRARKTGATKIAKRAYTPANTESTTVIVVKRAGSTNPEPSAPAAQAMPELAVAMEEVREEMVVGAVVGAREASKPSAA